MDCFKFCFHIQLAPLQLGQGTAVDAGNSALTMGVNLIASSLPAGLTVPAAPGVTASSTLTELAVPTVGPRA
jgi:hypothetical protein